MSKMTTCKHCGAEIAASAKTCPKCGGKNKKPIYKRPWFIILAIIIVMDVIGSMGGNSSKDSTKTASNSSTVKEDTTKQEVEATEAPIEYTAYDVSELMNDLEGNALKAKEKYKDQYVELTGRLSNIDSDGKYIDIVPQDDEWTFTGVQCYVKKNEEAKAAIMDLSKDDVITVKGKITDVGEVLGYFLDIDEITK